ncbi:protein PTST homolog 3, chloroplastic isoform X2 [Punica granatum]|uniref:Protein PTST homolog 3, chloroplastic isoform X2 n=1 Tax=Punica granatum TaxID=22663 RepID=A0A6P8DKL0_PUNGR|nr:protein PTST homolog 3, chloroplastic isoform X2 [Punica granatum]
MAALTLHVTTSFTLSPYRLLFHHRRERPKLVFSAPTFSSCHRFSVCCASIRRRPRKVMSNVELRNEIKEFLSSVGFPEDHVPSIKELSLHGRNDLANIIRRRGYKLVRELLTNSLQMDVDESIDMQDGLADKEAEAEATASGKVEQLEGQDKKAENLAEQTYLSDEVLVEEHFSVGHDVRPHISFHGDKYANQEPPVILYSEEKDPSFDGDGLTNYAISLKEGTTAEEDSSGFDTKEESDFSNIERAPAKTSNNLDSEVDASSSFRVQVEELDYNGQSISSSTDAPYGEICPENSEFDSMGNAGRSSELPDASTLEEKVAKFMADGYLDPVEDNPSGIYKEIGGEEPVGLASSDFTDSENGLVIRSKTTAEVQPVHVYGSLDAPVTLHESTSNPGSSCAKLDYSLVDNQSSGEGNADMRKVVDTEMSREENRAEISQLKYMLHQKELELSRLKEEIEREELALSFLQRKAENEINKAQKLILEKDAELQAAEESLSGLKEVEIQYCGDGDIVEVSGSFSGWHHRIKMDPQPLAGTGSRKSRLWSTVLWLYPGAYEIKFIVDGQWKVDPTKESTTEGAICNNILRVDR